MMKEKKANASSKKIILAVAVVVLLAATAAALLYSCVFIGGKIVSTSETELDLSNTQINDVSPICRLSKLESLNLRGCNISAEDYLKIQSALPECDITWSIPIGNQFFEDTAAEIILSASDCVTADQLECLRFADNLQSFDASGIVLSDECIAVLDQLRSDIPTCSFSWDISFGDQLFPIDSTIVALPADTTEQQLKNLVYFNSLESIDATLAGTADSLSAAVDAVSGSDLVWSVDLLGTKVLSTDTFVDISGLTVTDLDAFSAQLDKLPALKKIDMCNCGLSNEQMEQLMAAHPEKKFVWLISFARWTNIRTDIVCFSALNSITQSLDENSYAPLFKYCTDLVALDLGHNSIKDISLIANLTKLQALILGDNNITDISPLGALKELEYLELWRNDFTDISVLTTLPNLKDLNMTYCYHIEDFEPLFNLPQIEMIWIQNSGFPTSLPERLEEKYPDCMFSFYVYNSAHGNGWCWQDRYYANRLAFRNWQKVVRYDSWQDIEFVEGAKLLPVVRKWD